MERPWKLGKDMMPYDNVLDGFTFDDVILAVRCNCRNITKDEVIREIKTIINGRLEDMYYLLTNNIEEIMDAAKKVRKEA